jgi:hypothetical protein
LVRVNKEDLDALEKNIKEMYRGGGAALEAAINDMREAV